jgi:F-type H+-transporting ATPase subunit alpha
MKEGRLISAIPLEASVVQQIEAGFASKFGIDVRFDVSVDESLLGGFVAVVEGIVYDVSYKMQLDTIRRHLSE